MMMKLVALLVVALVSLVAAQEEAIVRKRAREALVVNGGMARTTNRVRGSLLAEDARGLFGGGSYSYPSKKMGMKRAV